MKRSELKQLIKECVKVILSENRSKGVPTEPDEIVKTKLGEYYIFDLRKLAQDWHSGQWSAFYAFSSSGYIIPGLAGEARKAKAEYEKNPEQYQNDQSQDDYMDIGDMFDAIISLEDRLPKEVDEAITSSDEEPKLKGKFVNRGTVKLESGVDPKLAHKAANYHWDIFGEEYGKDGVWNFKTRGDRYCCTVGLLNNQLAMLNVTTTPGRLQLLVGMNEIFDGDDNGDRLQQEGNEVAGTPSKDDRDESYYIDAKDMESDAENVKNTLETIKKAGLGDKYSELMTGIFSLPVSEFNKRSALLSKLEIKAHEIVKKNSKLKEISTTGGVSGYNTPFAFSKNTKGSKKAISASKGIGYIPVKNNNI